MPASHWGDEVEMQLHSALADGVKQGVTVARDRICNISFCRELSLVLFDSFLTPAYSRSVDKDHEA